MLSDCCPKPLTHQPEITSVHMLSKQHLITKGKPAHWQKL